MQVDVSAELAVMQSVGNALAQLPDARSRARVLRWAATQVKSAEQVAEVAQHLYAGEAVPDPAVSLDGLSELFPNLGPAAAQDLEGLDWGPQGSEGSVESVESLDTLIRGLAAELGQFAIAWQRA